MHILLQKYAPSLLLFLVLFGRRRRFFPTSLRIQNSYIECSQRAGEALKLGVHNVLKQIIFLYPQIILKFAQKIFFALSLSGHCLRSIVMTPKPHRGYWSVFF